MRWDPTSRSLTLELPRSVEVMSRLRHKRWARWLAFFVCIDLMMAYVDRPLAEYMRSLDQEFIDFFRMITKAGDSQYWLVPIALVFPFLLAARQAITDGSVRRMLNWGAAALGFAFVAIAASGLLVDVIKIIFGRARPRVWFEEGFYGFIPFTISDSHYKSFPSGHADTIMAAMVALACFFPRIRYLLFAVALPIAASRVIITAHYLSDVITGGVIGYFFTYWLRDKYARNGWVFVRQNGRYRVKAPGQLMAAKVRSFLWAKLGLPDGPRGRLP